ncbi:MAG: hypothetical protein EP344_15865 [Bacteroidetes bacterium]|nr:MAG: hypothetical protein EP344_15865 [Bacteroidota bacterium]
MQHENQVDWDNILDDIEDQLCVLFLGPEVIHVGDLPLNQYVSQNLHQRHQSDIVFYYQTDGLFLFPDAESKVRVSRQVKRLYRNLEPDDAVFRKIAEIPFHLIISLNPDSYLSDTMYKYGIKHRFYHFQHQRPQLEDMDPPGKSMPVIYNLCGSKNDSESLILDYEDLFEMLQGALGNPGLPDRLRAALRQANTFIFLGFQLEKWYTQLLLRLLSERPGVEKIAVNTVTGNAHTRDFLLNQFKLKFPETETDFLTALHQRVSSKNLNRAVSEPKSEEVVSVIRHIQQGDLEEAMQLLFDMDRPELDKSAITVLLSRFAQWNRSVEQETIYAQEAHVEYNRMVDATLEIVRQLT